MDKYRIVLVDDEERLVQCLDLILTLDGHSVIAAKDGDTAYHIIEDIYKSGKTIDLLITDIWMPGMSGLALLDKLNQLDIKCPVLGITGFIETETAEELMKKGLVGLISKPFKPEELLKRIKEVLRDKSFSNT